MEGGTAKPGHRKTGWPEGCAAWLEGGGWDNEPKGHRQLLGALGKERKWAPPTSEPPEGPGLLAP